MRVFNKTGDSIMILGDYNEVELVLPPDGSKIELRTITREVGHVKGVPLNRQDIQDVVGLPPAKLNIFYIVTEDVKKAFPSRTDLITLGKVVKDAMGTILGIRSFSV